MLAVPLVGTATDPDAARPRARPSTSRCSASPARDPDGADRLAAREPGRPRGVGHRPGPRRRRSFLPDDVTDRFDVIGWDPRGVGASAPIDCGARLDYLFSGDTSPDDTAEWAALDDVSRRFAEECGTRTGAELLGNISTLATVHDMERIRRSLGEEQISFLGFSYGTELGALYATLLPGPRAGDGARRRRRSVVVGDGVGDAAGRRPRTGPRRVLRRLLARRRLPDPRRSFGRLHRRDGEHRGRADARARRTARSGSSPRPRPTSRSRPRSTARAPGPTCSARSRARTTGTAAGCSTCSTATCGATADGNYGDEWPAFLAITCLDGPSLGGPDVYPRGRGRGDAARAPLRGRERRARAAVRLLVGPDRGAAAVGVGADRARRSS